MESNNIVVPATHMFNQHFIQGMKKVYERVECTEKEAYWLKKLANAIDSEMNILRGMFADVMKKYVVDGQPPAMDKAWGEFMEGIKEVSIDLGVLKFNRQLLSNVLMSTAERTALEVILMEGEKPNV